MAYNKTNWESLPSRNTPINVGNLNKIENGIYDNSIAIETINTNISNINTNINNIAGTILWTNPNPTNTFPAQTINLSSDDYDILEIYYQQTNSDTRQTGSMKMLKGVNSRYIGILSGTLLWRNIDRNSDTSYLISGCSLAGYEDTALIPLYVIGYKTGLFDNV